VPCPAQLNPRPLALAVGPSHADRAERLCTAPAPAPAPPALGKQADTPAGAEPVLMEPG
jgi:hypothetical protein